MPKWSVQVSCLVPLLALVCSAHAEPYPNAYTQEVADRLGDYLAGQSFVCDPINADFKLMTQAEKNAAYANSFTFSAPKDADGNPVPTMIAKAGDMSEGEEMISQLNVGPEFIFLAYGDDGRYLFTLPFEPSTYDPKFPNVKFCMEGTINSYWSGSFMSLYQVTCCLQ